jgi:ABC-type multidrug transport system fused ATPase/permease subunit
MIVINKTFNQIETKFYDYISSSDENSNIMLKNLLLKKDMEFFDLFKTGELINKVQAYQEFPSFNFIETCTHIGQYIFKIFYYGYYLYKDYFEMTAIYFIIMFLQTFTEPFIYNEDNLEDIGEKYELRENYINDILANIRLVKSFGTEKKELKRISNIIYKIKKDGF